MYIYLHLIIVSFWSFTLFLFGGLFPCFFFFFDSLCWYLHIRKNSHLSHSSWTGLKQRTLTNQPNQKFWDPLKLSYSSKPPSLLLVATRYLEYSRSHQCSETCETEAIFLGSSQKCWIHRPTFSFPREKLGSSEYLHARPNYNLYSQYPTEF